MAVKRQLAFCRCATRLAVLAAVMLMAGLTFARSANFAAAVPEPTPNAKKSNAVLRRTGSSITFRATSNDRVVPTESKRYEGGEGGVPTFHDAIRSSAAFKDAFNYNEEEEYDIMRKNRRRNKSSNVEGEKRETEYSSAKIIQSSITTDKEGKLEKGGDGGEVHSAEWGLVSAVVDAYNNHHSLVLRPDDVWQAILTQFSFYVNAHAEELRDYFVDFKGKKTLVVKMYGSLFSANFADFSNRMVDEQIAPNLKNSNVTKWLLPDFSTTKPSDRVAASVTIMSTLQSYFEYVLSLACGIPEVTLEGTPNDWNLLREKINDLPKYDLDGKGNTGGGNLMTKWHGLLVPILDEFAASANGNPSLEFWDTVCSHHGGGSGPSYLSGWITVFACFTQKGNWQGEIPDKHLDAFDYYTDDEDEDSKEADQLKPMWPRLDTDSIPAGAVSVPVLVDDNGVQYDTHMLAGQFAYEMKAAFDPEKGEAVAADGGAAAKTAVHPRTDWCIAYKGQPKSDPRDYKHGKIHSEF